MVIDAEFRMNSQQTRRLNRTLKRAPKEIQQSIKQRWNVTALVFRRLMQDKHLSGGTTATRLKRITSTLFSSLRHEVIITAERIQVSVWFLDSVKDYAPTHEKGDPSRNIPARMNLMNEWKGFTNRFVKDAEDGIAEGLNNA